MPLRGGRTSRRFPLCPRHTPVPEKVSFPTPVDIVDFLNEPEPDYNFQIEDIIEAGDRVIITGREGKGKSTLLRQMAVLSALGIHPFTLQPMRPLKVLFVDLENPRPHVRREFRKMPMEVTENGMLIIACWPAGLDLSEKSQQLALAAVFKEYAPELVFIGPMYKLGPRLGNEDDAALLAHYLDSQRISHGFSLIMEAHQPHESFVEGERYRAERPIGSSVWLRWPEFGFCLEDNGRLRPWRGSRDSERGWPTKLTRGGFWPWTVDNAEGVCLVCGTALTGAQQKYCSDTCSETGRKREQRARKRAGS
jgi:energy-coupling factor transporter ATP-binding protein EcfA2